MFLTASAINSAVGLYDREGHLEAATFKIPFAFDFGGTSFTELQFDNTRKGRNRWRILLQKSKVETRKCYYGSKCKDVTLLIDLG
jgi:hypothetical protein